MTRPPDAERVSFTTLVFSLATTAAVHLGDLGDPSTGERAVNLEGARQMIDLLGILEEKTRGNLTPEERGVLEQVLFELRLRYVEVERTGGDAAKKIIVP
jgi:hypothetical protein